MTEAAVHTGSCHCGAVRFEVEADLESAIECNCSHCYRKGLMLVFAPAEAFTLKQGADALSTYRFHTHKVEHQSCAACGVQSFSFGTHPATGQAVVAVNVRTLEDVEPWSLSPTRVDGRSF